MFLPVMVLSAVTDKEIEGHALGNRNKIDPKLTQQTYNSGSNRVKKEEVDPLFRAHEDELYRKGKNG